MRVLAHDVHVTDEQHRVTVLKAGSPVPHRFRQHVTNPKAFIDGPDRPYAEWQLDQLRDELKQRGLPTSGNKPDLVERLIVDDEG
jgi:hypothetical protein